MLRIFNLEKTYHYLLMILAFLMPITVFGANLIITILVLIWIFSGNLKTKLNTILSNRFLVASIIFFSLHLFGLIWTEDLKWGLHIVHKMWYFLALLPILYTLMKKENIFYYISVFLLAISITEVLSYLVWFELIAPFKNATTYNPTPFMSHISYNPILAFAIYIVSHELLLNSKMSVLKKYIYGFFTISMSFNMFITGGRAGQVMFFAVIAILLFQYFRGNKFKAFGIFFIVFSLIFTTAFQTSTIFNKRVIEAVKNVQHYQMNKNTSVGQRISYTINSWEIIKKNPIIGVGTGDFPLEYNKVNRKNTPEVQETTNPHNMYVLILVQLGILGLISFLSIFFFQLKWAIKSKSGFIKDLGIAMPLLFLLIMWSDSYLLGHYTTLLYVFFSSFLYKDLEQS